MKKMKAMTGLFAAMVLLVANVFAVDLRNEDGRRYEVKIHSGASTLNTWIDANTTSPGVCSECEIEVEGVGRIKAKGSEKVVIKDGKLLKQ
jgi:hypothetical protein